MALNIRFLEKQGVSRTIAVSGVGMNTLAGFVGHMSLIAVFVVWAGRDAFGSFRLPDPKWAIVALAGDRRCSLALGHGDPSHPAGDGRSAAADPPPGARTAWPACCGDRTRSPR